MDNEPFKGIIGPLYEKTSYVTEEECREYAKRELAQLKATCPTDSMYGNFPITTRSEKFHDVRTHRDNWRYPIEMLMMKYEMCGCVVDVENITDHNDHCGCKGNASYWKHELEAFDRTFDLLEKELFQDENKQGPGKPFEGFSVQS